MEIRGKIIAVLPVKDGIGKTSGNEWKSREFVLETEESKPQSVCLQLMNANIERYAVEVGMTVHVKFDIPPVGEPLVQYADSLGSDCH